MERKIVLPLKKIKTMILKSELQIVPVEQRVPGRIYVVSDNLHGELKRVEVFKEQSYDIGGTSWEYWFELPESMLPNKEVIVMPEVGKEYEFSDNGVNWYTDTLKRFCTNRTNWQYIRPIQPLPSLTIPQSTKQEQIMALESLLNELKK
jgi:hypothetical protein